jgi:hypothetical protein
MRYTNTTAESTTPIRDGIDVIPTIRTVSGSQSQNAAINAPTIIDADGITPM